MDRSVFIAAVVFVALAVVGIFLAVSPASVSTDQAEAVRSIGAAMFGAGLTAVLVVALLTSRPGYR